jgi:hypothetical protein
MPDAQFQRLLKMIEQLGLEFQEFSKGIDVKFETISTSLKSCQTRCHVDNPPSAENA